MKLLLLGLLHTIGCALAQDTGTSPECEPIFPSTMLATRVRLNGTEKHSEIYDFNDRLNHPFVLISETAVNGTLLNIQSMRLTFDGIPAGATCWLGNKNFGSVFFETYTPGTQEIRDYDYMDLPMAPNGYPVDAWVENPNLPKQLLGVRNDLDKGGFLGTFLLKEGESKELLEFPCARAAGLRFAIKSPPNIWDIRFDQSMFQGLYVRAKCRDGRATS